MHTNTRRHRHLVLLPLFGLLFALPLSQGLRLTGSLISDTGSIVRSESEAVVGDTWLGLESSTDVLTPDGGIVLRHGEILAADRGLGRLQAGSYHLTFLGGAMHAAVYDGDVSVAALTASVLIESDAGRLLLPAGRQWRSESGLAQDSGWAEAALTDRLPVRFLKEQFARLPGELPLIKSFQQQAIASVRWLPDSFLLPGAREKRHDAEDRATVDALIDALESGTAIDVQTLLASDAVANAVVQTPALEAWLVDQLPAHASQAAIATPLLELLSRLNSDIWQLSAVHSELAPAAWLLPVHLQPSDIRAAALSALPFADMGPQGFGDLTVRRFGDELTRWLALQSDPAGIAASVVPDLQAALLSYERFGYPERHTQYQSVITAALASYLHTLPPESQDLLKKTYVAAKQAENDVVAEASAEEAVALYSQTEAVALATSTLKEAGALFTVETTIKPVAPDTVHVQSVVISGSNGDRLLSFDLNVASNRVANVVDGADTYSRSLSFPLFVEWARGES